MALERTNKVELRPTIQALFDMIRDVSKNLILVVQSVPRIALQITDKQRKDMEVGAEGWAGREGPKAYARAHTQWGIHDHCMLASKDLHAWLPPKA